MFRITTLFFCALFLAAVAGRYRAEESVQNAREELLKLEAEQFEEIRQVKMLRAEIAYLENPERLARIAKATTDLRPPVTTELMTASEFRNAILGEGSVLPPVSPAGPISNNAVAVAQLSEED